MSLHSVIEQFTNGMVHTSLLEYIAVFFGIGSVWYSRLENILVYPVGLVSTVIYIWLSLQGHLFGEASVNLYYSVMSIYGWWLWTRKDPVLHKPLAVTTATRKEWMRHLLFFTLCYVSIFVSLSILKRYFAPGAIPWADALASASAFTGMWLMAKKKVENWYWWILTNICSMPLYFVKGYVFTSVFYVILFIMAFWGLAAWRNKARNSPAASG